MSTATRDYELVIIALSTLDDEALAALNQRVAGWIAAAEGTVTGTNVWGRRQLAYAIGKKPEGIYIQVNFQLAPKATRDLERNLRLEEQVLRHLIIRLGED